MSCKSRIQSYINTLCKNYDLFTCIVLSIPFLFVVKWLCVSILRGYTTSSVLFLLTLIVWFLHIHRKTKLFISKLLPSKIKHIPIVINKRFEKIIANRFVFILRRSLFIMIVIICTSSIYCISLIDNNCACISQYKDTIKERYHFDVVITDGIKLSSINKYTLKSFMQLDSACCILEDFIELSSRFPDNFFTECQSSKACKKGMMLKLEANTNIFASTNFYYAPNEPLTITINVDKYQDKCLSQIAISHELFHFIERVIILKENSGTFDNDSLWSTYNPSNFHYYNSLLDDNNREDICEERSYIYSYENDIQDVYFTEKYAQENPFEDRACIFQYLLTSERGQLPECFESEHIQAKAKKICELIRANFDTVNGDDIYWEHFN